ncbi:MAG: tetratricopeptide repeat protein [Desulfosalsimonadaceae bacterium]|nr:tetratricopeptide repeat protein [Desulfosalsimonadaceae bacterium]
MKVFDYMMLALLLIGVCVAGCSKDSDQTVEVLNADALKLAMAGKVDQALEKATAAVEKAEKENGADHSNTAMSLETLGLVYQAKGDTEKAETAYLRALSIIKKTSGPDSEGAAKIMNNLAGLYYAKKQKAEAASFYKQALAIVEKKFPTDDPRLAVLRKNIGVCEGTLSGGTAAQPADTNGPAAAAQEQSSVKAPPVNPVQDLVPQQIKDSMTSQLAQQNIFISDLEPRPPVPIDKKGIVFPYHALKKGKDKEATQEVVVLFAAVANPQKPNAVIFQQCRLISHTSYLSALEKGGMAQLKQEIQEVFKNLYL